MGYYVFVLASLRIMSGVVRTVVIYRCVFPDMFVWYIWSRSSETVLFVAMYEEMIGNVIYVNCRNI